MKPNNMSRRTEQIFRCFSDLAEKILCYHDRENVTEFLLHSICQEDCFNLSKAAYLVDNSDFDCLKGVAGFDKNNGFDKSGIWKDIDNFDQHMKNCVFNQKVREIFAPSLMKSKSDNDYVLREISDKLSISKPSFHIWDIKHGNKAVLIYEPVADDPKYLDKDLLKCLCLLGFCPIF